MKKICAASLSVLLLFVLIACGGKDTTSNDPVVGEWSFSQIEMVDFGLSWTAEEFEATDWVLNVKGDGTYTDTKEGETLSGTWERDDESFDFPVYHFSTYAGYGTIFLSYNDTMLSVVTQDATLDYVK